MRRSWSRLVVVPCEMCAFLSSGLLRRSSNACENLSNSRRPPTSIVNFARSSRCRGSPIMLILCVGIRAQRESSVSRRSATLENNMRTTNIAFFRFIRLFAICSTRSAAREKTTLRSRATIVCCSSSRRRVSTRVALHIVSQRRSAAARFVPRFYFLLD